MENEQSKPKGINWKTVLIGVVIGTVLVGLGVAIYFLLQPKPEPTSTATTKQATPSAKIATPSAQKDETAEWKVYRTSTFTIKYPRTWFENKTYKGARQRGDALGGVSALDFSVKNPPLGSNFRVTFELDSKEASESLSIYAAKIACLRESHAGAMGNCDNPNIPKFQETIQIAGKESIRQELSTMIGPVIEVYVPISNTKVIAISTFDGSTDAETINESFVSTFEKMLSTFRFD